MNRIALAACAAAMMLGFGAHSRAATLTGTYTAVTSATTYNLTDLGTADWAYWSTSASSGVSAPTNEKASASIIGGLSAVGGGDVRGSSSSTRPLAYYLFSDGTTTVSSGSTPVHATGAFNTQLDTTNAGVSVAITLPTKGLYEVNVLGAVYDGTAKLDASLSGVSDYINTTLTGSNTPYKSTALYTLTVGANHTNDVLNVAITLSTNGGASTSSHAVISGVAVRVIPTPAALPAGAGLFGLLAMRRRKSNRASI